MAPTVKCWFLTTMSSASFQYGGYSRPSSPPAPGDGLEIEFAPYTSEAQLPEMVHLIEKELRYVPLTPASPASG